ncbi:MAG: DUF2752 domain-containing protein [Clostridiales bacterium]|jgi:hypothetical protein|nr:DUF2752 domain-containing protein [Clostridiales bacterium]
MYKKIVQSRVFKNKWVRLAALFTVFFVFTEILSHVFGTACIFKLITGVPCPSCGMTRAIGLFLSMRVGQAFEMHPLFPLAGVVFAGIIAVTAKPELKERKALKIAAYAIAAAFIVVYAVRMAAFFPDKEPTAYFWNSLVGTVIKLLSKG